MFRDEEGFAVHDLGPHGGGGHAPEVGAALGVQIGGEERGVDQRGGVRVRVRRIGLNPGPHGLSDNGVHGVADIAVVRIGVTRPGPHQRSRRQRLRPVAAEVARPRRPTTPAIGGFDVPLVGRGVRTVKEARPERHQSVMSKTVDQLGDQARSWKGEAGILRQTLHTSTGQ